MKQIIKITQARYVDRFKLEITFSDRTRNVVNFKEFLSLTQLPDLKKYLKNENFKNFKIVSGNIVWGDYEMIFPLIDLYEGHVTKKVFVQPNKIA